VIEAVDHVADGLGQAAGQYENSTLFRAWVASFLEQVQDLDGVVLDVLASLDIEQAEGTQLDRLGDIVGEPRSGYGDVAYRRAIRVKIRVNMSNGTIEDLLTIARLWGATEADLQEYYPAALQMHVGTAPEPRRLHQRLLQAKPAGVGHQTIYSGSLTSARFTLSATHGAGSVDADRGLGSAYTADGGRLSGVLV